VFFSHRSLYGDTDDFDPFGDNYANDGTENDALANGSKLNYHSYMNRQTRARWTKSDTDLFYQVFRNQLPSKYFHIEYSFLCRCFGLPTYGKLNPFLSVLVQGLQQFGSDFAMIQQLFPDKSRDQVRQKFKSEEKKHPMQVHDAILHRSKG
jgi:transcription factor TFIIIB component B''